MKKCHVHPVYGAGIRAHNLSNMSRFPQPLDQDSRPYLFLYFSLALGGFQVLFSFCLCQSNCPNVFKSCPNNIHISFYINSATSKYPKSRKSFSATVESEFVAKNFKKSPNLVTLVTHTTKAIVNYPSFTNAKMLLLFLQSTFWFLLTSLWYFI